MIKVSGDIEISSIKRCYGDIVIEIPCPNCGKTLIHDFKGDYFSHPEVGDVDHTYFYCIDCDENDKDCEFTLPVKILSAKIEIEYDISKIEVDK